MYASRRNGNDLDHLARIHTPRCGYGDSFSRYPIFGTQSTHIISYYTTLASASDRRIIRT